MKRRKIWPVLILATTLSSTLALVSCGNNSELDNSHPWSYRSNATNSWNPLSNYDYGQVLSYVKNPKQTIAPNSTNDRNPQTLALSNLPNWDSLLNLNANYLNDKSKYLKTLNLYHYQNQTISSSSHWNIDGNSTMVASFNKIVTSLSTKSAKQLVDDNYLMLSGDALWNAQHNKPISVNAVTKLSKVAVKNYDVDSVNFDNQKTPTLKVFWDSSPVYFKSDDGSSADLKTADRAFQLRTTVSWNIDRAYNSYTTTDFKVITYQKHDSRSKKFDIRNSYALGMGGRWCDFYTSYWFRHTSINAYNLYTIADVATTPNGAPITITKKDKRFIDVKQINLNYTIHPVSKWTNGEMAARIYCDLHPISSSTDNSWLDSSAFLFNSPLLMKDISYDFYNNQVNANDQTKQMRLGAANYNMGNIVTLFNHNHHDAIIWDDCYILGNDHNASNPMFNNNNSVRTFSMTLSVYQVRATIKQ